MVSILKVHVCFLRTKFLFSYLNSFKQISVTNNNGSMKRLNSINKMINIVKISSEK